MSNIEELETWQSNIKGRVVVSRRGEYGVERDEMVPGGKKLHITPSDRRMNQERAATPELDVFSNGMLVPIQIGEAASEFASNPNLLTEDDIREIVKGHPKTFEKRLSEIKNLSIVEKMLDIAKEEDCTVKRVEAIQARQDELSPINTVKIQSVAPDERQTTAFTPSVT